MNAVSDSDVVIDWLQGRPQALSVLATYEVVFISVITWMEVLSGVRSPEEHAAVRRALDYFPVEPLSPVIMERTVAVRRSSRLKLPDAAILATAQHLDVPLLTRNTKDFAPGGPGIIIPYTL